MNDSMNFLKEKRAETIRQYGAQIMDFLRECALNEELDKHDRLMAVNLLTQMWFSCADEDISDYDKSVKEQRDKNKTRLSLMSLKPSEDVKPS